jgi:glucans biosynthesis protein C
VSRNPAIERARSTAIIVVIAAHSIMAYMVTPVGWAINDQPGSVVVDGAIWIIQSFVMPSFFVLAGFAAAQTLLHVGSQGFARRRVRKLLVPFAVLLIPSSMLLSKIWHWGAMQSTTSKVSVAPPIEHTTDAFALCHLWFLYYLISYSVVALLLWLVPTIRRYVQAPRWSISTMVLLATPLFAAILLWRQLTEIETPQRLRPLLSAWLFYGTCFVAGFVGEPSKPRDTRRATFIMVALALVLFAGLVPSLQDRNIAPPWFASVLAACVSTLLIASFFDGQRHAPLTATTIAIADASFWTYIIHLPIVASLQVVLSPLDLPWPVKACIVCVSTAIVCLGSWRIVRRTRLRGFLG